MRLRLSGKCGAEGETDLWKNKRTPSFPSFLQYWTNRPFSTHLLARSFSPAISALNPSSKSESVVFSTRMDGFAWMNEKAWAKLR